MGDGDRMNDDAGTRLALPALPRVDGRARLTVKRRDMRSVIDTVRTSGAAKLLFPRATERLDVLLVNTAGGLTGGDRIELDIGIAAGATLALTTQAAERAYRAASGIARVESRVTVAEGGSLLWLPQELILYDHASLRRSLRVDLAPSARLLLVEPVIFGRAAMGETVRHGAFHDRIEITRDGVPLYFDSLRIEGDIAGRLARPAIGRSAGAMASVVLVDPGAEGHLDAIRTLLPATGGATLLAPDLLAVRLVAPDGYTLRRDLLPVLDRLTVDTLPAAWRL